MVFKYIPKLILGPGDSIREELNYYGWSQKDLSEILNISEKHLSDISNNKVPITLDMAKLLSKTFKQSPQYWINMDTNYRLKLEETADEIDTAAKALIFRYMPINQMRKLDWLTSGKEDFQKLINEVKKFWNINELKFDFIDTKVSARFRKSTAFEKFNPYYALTWLQKAKNDSSKINSKLYKDNELNKLAKKIPKFTLMENGILKFIEDLKECGVIFLHLHHLNQTYIDGASFFNDVNPVLVYTGRYNRDDNFWWTVAHEIAHITKHLKSDHNFYIDSEDVTFEETEQEREANDFAQTILKNNLILDQLKIYKYITPNTINTISKKINISCSVIVGCLQYNKIIPYSLLKGFKSKVFD